MRPALILDDDAQGRLEAFARPLGAIHASTAEEVPVALDAIEAALASGRYVAGYFSYELGYVLERRLVTLLPSARDVPLLWFGVFDAPAIIVGASLDAAFDSWIAGRAYAGSLTHEWDRAAYGARFDRLRQLIAAGDLYQANLSFRSRFAFVGDALSYFRSLRSHSAARYGAYIDDGERQILSLSPELFFDLKADGALMTRPMKGTAAREADPAADALARLNLAESTKNRAENLMIVDLLRNDLGRIAEIGSVGVHDLFAVETYPTVHQMVSTVTAQLKPGTGVEAVVRALFPCGSVTGAPKIRAMEVIAELEQGPRGVYCGAIGVFAPDGSARFNVAIRTLTIANGRGELGIGGAVVQDSDSASEYAECLLKARFVEVARCPLELIETLRFGPREGFVRLDLHLARLAHSAAAFGIAFDENVARQALHAAAENAIEGLRVRLVLSEDGAFACTASPLSRPEAAWTYAVSPRAVMSTDALAQHKTNWRDLYDGEHARLSKMLGCNEVIFLNERGEVVEGSRTNVFVAREGKLLTPPLSAGALDGILRRSLIGEGRCIEAVLRPQDLTGETYLGNSLRGLIRAVPSA
jgi:para-aminobenzoate synthetase/4-amino-4-deoxychorismate lyase